MSPTSKRSAELPAPSSSAVPGSLVLRDKIGALVHESRQDPEVLAAMLEAALAARRRVKANRGDPDMDEERDPRVVAKERAAVDSFMALPGLQDALASGRTKEVEAIFIDPIDLNEAAMALLKFVPTIGMWDAKPEGIPDRVILMNAPSGQLYKVYFENGQNDGVMRPCLFQGTSESELEAEVSGVIDAKNLAKNTRANVGSISKASVGDDVVGQPRALVLDDEAFTELSPLKPRHSSSPGSQSSVAA